MNPVMTPDAVGNKFCNLDILMTVNDKLVNLEIQVENEGDFPERVLFYWARTYINALPSGGRYIDLPRTIVISILDFKLFQDCAEFHSEFQLLEVSRNTALTDKQILHFFELPKLPDIIEKDDLQHIWLNLFDADTEEELKMIEELGVSEINEAITAYRSVTVSPEFLELERQREKSRINEASALHYAEQSGEKRGAKAERKKWRTVVAKKDAKLAEKDAKLSDKDTELSDKDAKLAEKDAKLADKDAQIAELQAKLEEKSK